MFDPAAHPDFLGAILGTGVRGLLCSSQVQPSFCSEIPVAILDSLWGTIGKMTGPESACKQASSV